jgi:hypothetical protein
MQLIYRYVYGIHRIRMVFPPVRIVAAGTTAGLAIELSRATIASPSPRGWLLMTSTRVPRMPVWGNQLP